jgi:hypothetical protein
MKRNAEKHSKAMTMANSLVKQGIGRSAATIKAWTPVKLSVADVKTAGVTHGKRQKALARLERCPRGMVRVTLERDAANEHDKNAVAVVATVEGKGSYVVGYLPRRLAAFVAPLLDAGKAVKAGYKSVTGGFDALAHRGLLIALEV